MKTKLSKDDAINKKLSACTFSNRRFSLIITALLALLILSTVLCIILGPVHVEPRFTWRILLHQILGDRSSLEVDWDKSQFIIVWLIRYPRVLLGLVVGAGLAVVGTGLQALTRNQLADPHLLGISSGASVTAVLSILFGVFSAFGQYGLSLSAFIGALGTMVLVYFIAQENGRVITTRLVLGGVALSMTLGGVTNLIVTMGGSEAGIRSALQWMLGSLSSASWEQLPIPAIVMLLGTAALFITYRSLNGILMGDDVAVSMGINVVHYRKFLLITTSVITGVLVAVSGAIGFIGLMVPHVARMIVGADNRKVIPVSMLIGAIFTIWMDLLARTVAAPSEFPIGVLTSIVGGPFFIWMLRKKKRSAAGRG